MYNISNNTLSTLRVLRTAYLEIDNDLQNVMHVTFDKVNAEKELELGNALQRVARAAQALTGLDEFDISYFWMRKRL